jgi:hypothetical protein
MAILCHVRSSSLTSAIVHTAISAHAPSEIMNVTTLTRINQFMDCPRSNAMPPHWARASERLGRSS